MESAYYALKTAERCLLQNKKEAVYIFLHDVQRKLENDIANRYFSSLTTLFIIPGPEGDLQGWKAIKNHFN